MEGEIDCVTEGDDVPVLEGVRVCEGERVWESVFGETLGVMVLDCVCVRVCDGEDPSDKVCVSVGSWDWEPD
jgi:hypothetical protein